MQCPRCKTDNQDGNYCSECGNQLKYICPECGEMEPIGRKVCFKRFNEIRTELKQDIKKKTKAIETISDLLFPVWLLNALAGLGCLVWVGFVFNLTLSALAAEKNGETIIGVLSSVVLVSYIFLSALLFAKCEKFLGKKLVAAKEKARQEFLENNPQKAEILRKAGIIKMKESDDGE